MKQALQVLSLLSGSDVEWLIAKGRRERVAVGQKIVSEGVPLHDMFLTLNGRFDVQIRTHDGGIKTVAELTGGEFVGEVSLLDRRPPTATVVATFPSEVMRIGLSLLLSKLDMSPDFGARFYRALAILLAQRLRRSTERLAGRPADLRNSDVLDEDEIDPELLESMELGGIHFRWILERLAS